MTVELESPATVLSDKQAAALQRRVESITKEVDRLRVMLGKPEQKGRKKCRLSVL